MVTIRTCSQLEDAQLMQSFLGGSGIESFIPDENSATNLIGPAIGGVRLQVEDEVAARADELLREAFPAPNS
jgi:hypothetical protein